VNSRLIQRKPLEPYWQVDAEEASILDSLHKGLNGSLAYR